jgi:hypothetical protein
VAVARITFDLLVICLKEPEPLWTSFSSPIAYKSIRGIGLYCFAKELRDSGERYLSAQRLNADWMPAAQQLGGAEKGPKMKKVVSRSFAIPGLYSSVVSKKCVRTERIGIEGGRRLAAVMVAIGRA